MREVGGELLGQLVELVAGEAAFGLSLLAGDQLGQRRAPLGLADQRLALLVTAHGDRRQAVLGELLGMGLEVRPPVGGERRQVRGRQLIAERRGGRLGPDQAVAQRVGQLRERCLHVRLPGALRLCVLLGELLEQVGLGGLEIGVGHRDVASGKLALHEHLVDAPLDQHGQRRGRQSDIGRGSGGRCR